MSIAPLRQFFRFVWQNSVFFFGSSIACVVWASFYFGTNDTLTQLEERSGDVIWRLSADGKDERRLIVIDIDERSLHEVGPWPWPRSTQARLVKKLASAGVQQQVFDIVFTDQTGADDAMLVQAVQEHKPVLAQLFATAQTHSIPNSTKSNVQAVTSPDAPIASGELAGALDWPACTVPFDAANGYLANFAALVRFSSSTPTGQNEGAVIGHITPRVANDGLVRHQPAVVCFQGKAYPALGIAAMMQGAHERSLALERGTSWFDPPWRLSAPGLVPGAVPLNNQGDLRVSWQVHPASFISLSAADVLAGRVPAGLLQNAWVLVGSSAFGLNDTIATPFGGVGAGLQVHAQIITALIDGRTPFTPRGEAFAQVLAATLGLILLFASVTHATLRQHLRAYWLPLIAALWCGLLWSGHALLLRYNAVWLGWVNPSLFVLTAGTAMGFLAHAQSRIERDRLYAHLSSYLPAPVAAALALQPPSSAIKASTNWVSVMFADIRNFSAYCESRPPEEAAAVLHAFFSSATRIVQAHGGVIEAFQGDAVLAVWNGEPTQIDFVKTQYQSYSFDVPFPTVSQGVSPNEHAKRTLQAAIALQSAMRGVLPDPAPAGLEPLSLGIGIEAGPAMAGSFGQASRRTHMVLGRTVTIASRLVGMSGELAHPILIGEGLAAQLGGANLTSMGTFLLDGMRVPHHVYAYPAQFFPLTEVDSPTASSSQP